MEKSMGEIEIIGVGTTGSGRYLANTIIGGADIVKKTKSLPTALLH